MKVYFRFILFLIIVLPYSVSAQNTSYVFHQLSVKDGLSEGTVRVITEDTRGFMWFGTEDGLNKYDGYKFTVYKADLNNAYSISSNNIKSFYNDKEGNLWIGTRHGINIYDPVLDRFYNFNSPDYFALKNIKGEIESIFEDHQKNVWVLSSNQGLLKITDKKKKPEVFQFLKDDNVKIFTSIAVDEENNFLIGTQDGLIRFNTKTNTFTDLREQYGMGYHVRNISIDSSKNVWFSTSNGLKCIQDKTHSVKDYGYKPMDPFCSNGKNTIRILPEKEKLFIVIDGGGLDLFDPHSGQFDHYTKENGSQLSSNNCTAIYKDSKGTLWIGTFMNGVNFSNISTNLFVLVKNGSLQNNSVKNGVVTAFLRDAKENLWIATDGGGLNVRRKNSNHFINYSSTDKKPIIGSDAVLNLMKDHIGNIWISTYAGGLTCIKASGTSVIYHHNTNDPTSLSFDKVKALCEYGDEIWISTFGKGLSVYSEKTGKFRSYRCDSTGKGIPSEWMYWIMKDSRGTLWFATFEGLTKYIPSENSFKTYQFNVKGLTIDKNYVFDIFEDKSHNLWLGTNGGGLILFDRDQEKFTSYTEKNGLSNNAVRTVVEDNIGNLWLATNNGITKFNIATKKATPYTINDGLPALSFYFNSRYKDESGKVYFGTNEGYLIIDPSLSEAQNVFPKVVLTELRIFNVPVIPGIKNSPLDQSITEAKSISLSYDQNSLSFEFAALNFSIPRHNYYEYKLEGFEENWNYSGKVREAKYTNLDPGRYVLKIRASNNEKVWKNNVTEFKIIIKPPFWQTWWFQILVAITIILSITGFIYLRTKSIRRRNMWLTDQINERTKELQESNLVLTEQNEEIKIKTNVILNQQKELLDKKYTLEKSNESLEEWNGFQQKLIGIIGHDIRGPLQRFSSLLGLMDDESYDFVMEKMKESAGTLSLLATDLLSWVSLQSSKGEMERTDFYWKTVFDQVKKEMEPEITEKKLFLNYKLISETEDKVTGVYPVTLSAVRNVLANAIRYSAEQSVIEIESGIVKNGAGAIRITDFGKGFDAADVNRMISGEGFKGMRSATLKEGAGLGMTICYDMMKRTGGWIEAASLPGSGGTFLIFLPLSNSQTRNTVQEEDKKQVVAIAPEIKEDTSHFLRGKTILLVDDDDEIRWSLVKTLSNYILVYEVRSAEEALDWLKDHTPDMALIDVRMSGMSGIELCGIIKKSPLTAHVPCMLITGETGEQVRKKVFAAGADTFLLKPFQEDELLLQIISYFENHEKKLKRFFNENIPVDQITENEINKEFLSNLVSLVENNLRSPVLNVDFLSKELGMSKSTLYRNIKALTDQSPIEFITNIRMRKSMLLLKAGSMNISEIATETGFNSPSYFSTSFKKHFGFNPTELK